MADTEPSRPQNLYPFPEASYLRELEELSPGYAERAIRIIEVDATTKRLLEDQWMAARKAEMSAEFAYARLGLVFAFIVAVLFIGAATWLGLKGHEISSSCLSITGLAVIIGKFIQGRSRRSESERPTPEKLSDR